jgi:hypothetical protein
LWLINKAIQLSKPNGITKFTLPFRQKTDLESNVLNAPSSTKVHSLEGKEEVSSQSS